MYHVLVFLKRIIHCTCGLNMPYFPEFSQQCGLTCQATSQRSLMSSVSGPLLKLSGLLLRWLKPFRRDAFLIEKKFPTKQFFSFQLQIWHNPPMSACIWRYRSHEANKYWLTHQLMKWMCLSSDAPFMAASKIRWFPDGFKFSHDLQDTFTLLNKKRNWFWWSC